MAEMYIQTRMDLQMMALSLCIGLVTGCGSEGTPPDLTGGSDASPTVQSAKGAAGEAGRGGRDENGVNNADGTIRAVGGTTVTAGAAAGSGGYATTITAVGGSTAGKSATGNGGSTGGAAAGHDGASGAAGAVIVPGLPARADVLEAMRRANAYFMKKWTDPTKNIVTDKTRPSNLWTRAVYYEGLMALYSVEPDSTKKKTYYDYAVTWASAPAHPYAMANTAATTMTANADNQACGQTYIDLYRIDPQPERIAVIKANIDAMITGNTVNEWTWIDAIHMAMPVFAKLGKTTGETRYFDAMWALYEYSRDKRGGGLFNETEGLWWRDHHFTPSGGAKQVMTRSLHNNMPAADNDAYIVAPNGKNLHWSRGNGWVISALARVLEELPTNDGHRNQYIADFTAMATALRPIQRGDGFWPESLADPTHCETIGLSGQDAPETSGTALFAYGLAWGIRNGLLDPATHGLPLKQAWNGLTTLSLQSNGQLGYAQSTGDRPCTGPAPLGPTAVADFEDYSLGCLLLAGSEVYRLASEE
jgi:unsaturated rhamnogalacturonyl hydrolase